MSVKWFFWLIGTGLALVWVAAIWQRVTGMVGAPGMDHGYDYVGVAGSISTMLGFVGLAVAIVVTEIRDK